MTEMKEPRLGKGEEIYLKDIVLKIARWWRYLLSKFALIFLCGIAGGALGLIYSYLKKPVYTSTTTFVLEDEKESSGLGSLAGLASFAGVDLGGSGGGIFQGDNILELYKSRTMLQKTLLTSVEIDGKKQLLIDRYLTFNDVTAGSEKISRIGAVEFSTDSVDQEIQFSKKIRLRDSILGVVVRDLNRSFLTVAKPDKKTNTIQVDVKSKDEFFAKSFNDELVKNVNQFYINTKTKKTLQNVKILQEKTDSVRAVMNGAIYTAVAVSDATPNLNPTRQVQRVAPAQKAQFSAETNKSILAEMVKNLELTKLSLLKETPLIQVIDAPIYPLKMDKVGKLAGIIVGGVLAVLMTVFILIVQRLFNAM